MARQQTSPDNSGESDVASALRALPSVDTLVQRLVRGSRERGEPLYPHARLTEAARVALRDARNAIHTRHSSATDLDALIAHAEAYMRQMALPAPRPVINATGVIINTNLGRAPLSNAAIEAIAQVAAGYSALEFDLERGDRGSRQTPVRQLLRDVTGAEDALVVNNNAAALLLILTALATGREVIISRGELVEIGGGFRIPDVLRQSGATLVEVGTTNRTRSGDFRAAIAEMTALLLSVHTSNYRIVGFTASAPLEELARLAHEHDLPLVHDIGSGALLRTERWNLAHEPMPQESLAAGADLVCFSGDKLMGGPQAGIIVGKADLIARLEHHPLMRAIRVDKLTLAAMAATLRPYRDGIAETEVPIWRMIAAPVAAMKERAERLAAALQEAGIPARTQQGLSTIGGGSMPGETRPTWLCAVTPLASGMTGADDAVGLLAARLRTGTTPVLARVQRDQLLLDPRTVMPDEDSSLLQALLETATNR